ncbi:MAG: hypothetical protein FWE74_01175 [Oscillospiraceae bacterium]|nr:hypothetical protein [Oscillospiraceae bacterium]
MNIIYSKRAMKAFELIMRLAPDDIAAHNIAMEEYRRGETIRHEDIDWS